MGANGPPIIPQVNLSSLKQEKQIRVRVLCLTFPLAATRQDCSGCLAFFFPEPQSCTLICKCYTLLWQRNQHLCQPDVSPSPLALFMRGCECEGEKRVKPQPRITTAALPQISLGTSFGWSAAAAKTHLKRQRKCFKPSWELKLTSHFSGVTLGLSLRSPTCPARRHRLIRHQLHS